MRISKNAKKLSHNGSCGHLAKNLLSLTLSQIRSIVLRRLSTASSKCNLLSALAHAIKNKITHKERFLFACAYSFYIQQANIELDGVNFLPFLNAKHKHDWAKLQANKFVRYCKKNKIVKERYKLALSYAHIQH